MPPAKKAKVEEKTKAPAKAPAKAKKDAGKKDSKDPAAKPARKRPKKAAQPKPDPEDEEEEEEEPKPAENGDAEGEPTPVDKLRTGPMIERCQAVLELMCEREDSFWFLEPDDAQNNEFDRPAARFFYRRCQELGVPLIVVTRDAVMAVPVLGSGMKLRPPLPQVMAVPVPRSVCQPAAGSQPKIPWKGASWSGQLRARLAAGSHSPGSPSGRCVS